MDIDLTSTIRIVRKPKVVTDAVGGTVWVDDVKSVELELVSTQMLEIMMDADEDTVRMKLQDVDATGNGVLARDVSKPDSEFEVVTGKELEQALAEQTSIHSLDDAQELQLVSTQMVQALIDRPDMTPKQVSQEMRLLEEVEAAGGYDPYNNC
ncbi:MAG: hypothetical protein AAGF46_06790 [Pseudomonadota bacterium]